MIRNAIKKALAGRGWSAYKLAQLADIPSNNVYAFLKGKDTLSLAKVEALLSLLDLEIEPSPLADYQRYGADIPYALTPSGVLCLRYDEDGIGLTSKKMAIPTEDLPRVEAMARSNKERALRDLEWLKDKPTKTTGEVGFIDITPPHRFGLINCDGDGKFTTGI